jgi:hypothetical protein
MLCSATCSLNDIFAVKKNTQLTKSNIYMSKSLNHTCVSIEMTDNYHCGQQSIKIFLS